MNLLTNGGFETGDLTGWTEVNAGNTVTDSLNYLIFDGYTLRGGSDDGLGVQRQEVAVPGGAVNFTLSSWFVNAGTDNDHPFVTVEFLDGADASLAVFTLNPSASGGPYVRFRGTTDTVPVGAVTARVEVSLDRIGSGINNCGVDEVWLQFDAQTTWEDTYNAETVSRLTFANGLIDSAADPKEWDFTGNAAIAEDSPYATGNSVAFLGAGDSLRSSEVPAFVGETASHTLYFWLKLDTLNANQGIFFQGSPGSSTDRYQMYINGSGDLKVICDVDSVRVFDVGASAASLLTAGQWHFIEVMKTNRRGVVFVDGSVVFADTFADIPEQVSGLFMGSARSSGNFVGMVGNIADVWIINGVAADRIEYTSPTAPLPLPAGPTIVTYPVDTHAIEGDTVSFTVTATGTGAIAYQWYSTTSGLISGATDATLSLSAEQAISGSSYYVELTDSNGTVETPIVFLTVSGVIDGMPRTALCWNFEDDNFTWFDAAHDTVAVTTGYSLTAYRDALLSRGVDGLWILDDQDSVAVDQTGDYNGSLNGDYTQGEGSFLDDLYRATLFETSGFMWITGAGASGMITSRAFAAGFIGTIDSMEDRALVHKWDNDANEPGLALYVSNTNLRVEFRDDTNTLQYTYNLAGAYASGDVIFLDLHTMSSDGVYEFDVYKNFQVVGSDSGDLAGTYGLGSSAYLEWAFTGSRTMQYLWYKSGGLEAGDVEAIQAGYNANFVGFQPQEGEAILDPVVCMKFQFDPGWEIRWSDLENDGVTWTDLSGSNTLWSDFYSGGAEENMYWLTESAVLLSDQLIKKDGAKQYYLRREQIDLNSHVKEWTTDRWIYANQFYFHMESEINTDDTSFVGAKIGWSDSMMDTPNYSDVTLLSIQSRENNGDVKWDFRSTGRYLALDFNFNASDAIRFVGGELNAEQTYGR